MNKATTVEQMRILAQMTTGAAAEVAGAAAEAIEELAGAKSDKSTFQTVVLAAAGWTENPDTETASAGYGYRYALPAPGALAADSAECIIAPASVSDASAYGLCPSTDVVDGYIYLYAASAPEAGITIQARLIPGAV